MSWKATGRVWDLKLDHSHVLVLLALADHADHLGMNCHPSIGLLAWKTGYSDRQIRRILRSLEDRGIISVQENRPGTSQVYRINFEAAPQKTPYEKAEAGRPQKPRTKCPTISELPQTFCPPSLKKTPDILTENPGHPDVLPTPDILTENPGHPDVRLTDNGPLNGKEQIKGTASPDGSEGAGKTKRKEEGPKKAAIPGEIDTPEFRNAWEAFISFRSQFRNAPFTKYAAELILRDLRSVSTSEAIARLEQSISKGWRGVFPVKSYANPQSTSRKFNRNAGTANAGLAHEYA